MISWWMIAAEGIPDMIKRLELLEGLGALVSDTAFRKSAVWIVGDESMTLSHVLQTSCARRRSFVLKWSKTFSSNSIVASTLDRAAPSFGANVYVSMGH